MFTCLRREGNTANRQVKKVYISLSVMKYDMTILAFFLVISTFSHFLFTQRAILRTYSSKFVSNVLRQFGRYLFNTVKMLYYIYNIAIFVYQFQFN